MRQHLYIGNHQGPPPLQRGEYLAEKCHPGSLRLRHWAPPLESEGPLVPGTHRRAVTRRLQDHASYCKIRAVRRHSQGYANSHQDTITTKYELTARKLDPQRRGSSTRPSPNFEGKLKIYNSSQVVAPMIEPVSEDRQTCICSSTTLQRRIKHATAWCTRSTRRQPRPPTFNAYATQICVT